MWQILVIIFLQYDLEIWNITISFEWCLRCIQCNGCNESILQMIYLFLYISKEIQLGLIPFLQLIMVMNIHIAKCEDSLAAMPCAKFCNNYLIRTSLRVKQNVHEVWLIIEKTVNEMTPWNHCWSWVVLCECLSDNRLGLQYNRKCWGTKIMWDEKKQEIYLIWKAASSLIKQLFTAIQFWTYP